MVKYVAVVQDMYKTVVNYALRVMWVKKQGSEVAVVMNRLTDEIQQNSPLTVKFANVIVDYSESREQIEPQDVKCCSGLKKN